MKNDQSARGLTKGKTVREVLDELAESEGRIMEGATSPKALARRYTRQRILRGLESVYRELGQAKSPDSKIKALERAVLGLGALIQYD